MIALILLTALRGMVGDVMAMEMSRMHSTMASVLAQSQQLITNHSDVQPCHEAGDNSTLTEHASPECTSCQVCHSPALPFLVSFVKQASCIASYTDRVASYWVSAELTHLQKPPVS